MTINFKHEVEKRKDDLLKDLTELIQINSELTTYDPNQKGAPFGPGNQAALDWFLALAQKDGFRIENVDGYAGHIEYGTQKEFVGSIGHLDVVSAGNGWTFPPYGAVIHDNKMYGRGTEDDKGPTIAVYYALKILKDLNVPLSKRIKLILGLDEETGWRCVGHYFKVHPEQPVSGFIADADFPLIYAEKGISRLIVEGKIADSRIVSIQGGFRDNMVPDYATIILKKEEDLVESFQKFLAQHNYQGTYQIDKNEITLTIEGKSAHGATPEHGQNAIDRLFQFLIAAKITNQLTDLYKNLLLNDYAGQKLGINYLDPEMGPVTNNIGIIKLENQTYQIFLNFRYPNGVSFDDSVQKIKTAVSAYQATLKIDKHDKLLYQDPNSDLIQKLLSIYIKHTGDTNAKPLTIGGGTFARAMQNVVAFGPHFAEKPTFIHQKDEFIDLDDLFTATAIYAEALYELAK